MSVSTRYACAIAEIPASVIFVTGEERKKRKWMTNLSIVS
jgi:hypothetical protein